MNCQSSPSAIPENAIAIIGMAGRFPGASDIQQFWDNLAQGVESIHHFTDAELLREGIPEATLSNPNYVKANATLKDYDKFDASFFGFTPGEASILDPQQRLLFESSWTALEHAGYVPNAISCPVGVFVGVGANTYLLQNLLPNKKVTQAKGAFQLNVASDKDFAATHIAYKLNLTGPCLTVQTACSTSLVAIHTACQNLLSYQCDMAIAGGSSLSVPQETGYMYSEGGIASPDGHCRPFTDEANGTVRGSGVGVVTLKRLESALEDNDTIHAVILSSANNNDGAAKVGYTAPSVDGQAEVIAMAQSYADIDPASIDYIETHGTGTPLGDPVEFEALSRAFENSESDKHACALGAVKGNIGHLDCAAGVTGLIKTALSLSHKKILPNLHTESTNSKIDFASSPFYLPNTLSDWQSSDTPRRAGISSFGIGGTNAHVILQEAPLQEAATTVHSEEEQLIVLSARTASGLDILKEELAQWLSEDDAINLRDVAYTLQVGRSSFEHRFFCVSKNKSECIEQLKEASAKSPSLEGQESPLMQMGAAWQVGNPVNWNELYIDITPKRVPLPTYPFEKTRHWIDPVDKVTASNSSDSKGLQKSTEHNIAYVPTWQEAPLDEKTAAPVQNTRCWLFINDTHEHRAVSDHFKQEGYDVQAIFPEPAYVENDDALKKLFSEHPPVDGEVIVHLWNHTAPEQAQLSPFNHLLFLAKALGEHRSSASLKLLIACDQLFSIKEELIAHPEHALLTGPALVIAQEMPNIKTSLIDIPELSASQIQQELTQGFQTEKTVIAYRNTVRYARSFSNEAQTKASQATAIQFAPKGIYWITGGLGGMGMAFAQQLAQDFDAQVILSSRSLPTAEQAHCIETLNAESQGTVTHVQADVTSLEAMQQAKEEITQQFGAINGLIHSAGVPGGSVLARKETEEAAQVMAPKVQGLDIIERLFQDSPDTAIVLCSSIAALQGGFGQADYCSANAYLDAWAQAQQSKGRTNVTSINWDGWIESGMAVNAAQTIQAKTTGQSTTLDYPLFDSVQKTKPNTTLFKSTYTASSHWVLAEHRIGGTAVFPGTAYLELVRAACAITCDSSKPTLSEIYFLTPLTLTESETRNLTLTLTIEDEQGHFSIATTSAQSPQAIEHAKGKINLSEATIKADTSLPQLEAQFAGKDISFSNSSSNNERGPRWQTRQWIKKNEKAFFSLLTLSPEHCSDLDAFLLHPALLDVAIGFPNDSDDFYVPFAYSKIAISSALPATVYSWIREQDAFAPDMKSFDITLYDQAGNVLIDIENYQVRKFTAKPEATTKQASKPTNSTQRLAIKTPGVFSSLQWIESPRKTLDADSVEIEVDQTSLNFKDILKALGTINDPNAETLFGDECCGTITNVGSNVTALQPGDKVIALAPSAFQLHLTVHHTSVLALPDALPLDIAASFSIAAMTAYHALINLAQLKANERILIQAATGGVGLAAVYVAQHIGAEIYATAGSQEKRGYLHSLGIKHVYDSRSLDFAEQIKADTQGEGVDVVLNSLAGDHITAGIDVLRRYGRFLELGKRDILENNTLSLRPFDRSLSFIAANLDRDYPRFREIWNQTLELLTSGAIPPLPTTVFEKANIADAFQYMARAQHIGKVVVSLSEAGHKQQASNAATTGLTDKQGQEALLLALQSNAPQVVISTVDLLQRISNQQNAYKVLKSAVKASSSDTSQSTASNTLVPTSPGEAQKAIKAIWHDILGIEAIDIDDNFFEIGGDSLAAVQVLSHLNDTFQKQIPIATFFTSPTIKALAVVFGPTEDSNLSTNNDELAQSLERGRQRKARRNRRNSH